MQHPAATAPSIVWHITPNNAPTLNVLIQMKSDNKSDYTINFTRKALNFPAEQIYSIEQVTEIPSKTRKHKRKQKQSRSERVVTRIFHKP